MKKITSFFWVGREMENAECQTVREGSWDLWDCSQGGGPWQDLSPEVVQGEEGGAVPRLREKVQAVRLSPVHSGGGGGSVAREACGLGSQASLGVVAPVLSRQIIPL